MASRLLPLLLMAAVSVQETSLPRIPADRTFPGLTAEKESRWTGPFFFIQLADPQFGFMDAAQERKNAELTVQHINRLKPRFVIVCGDLIHPNPGTPDYDAKVAEFMSIFTKIDPAIPLVCVPGNHDIGNTPTVDTIATYRRRFGDDYFSFWSGGVRCLVVNSTLYHDPSKAAAEQKQQEEWFARELAANRAAKPRHTLVFQHHPWFLKEPEEKDGYFVIPKVRRSSVLAMMKDAGVKAIFAGHYHGNAGGKDGDMEMITTGPVGKPLRKDPSGLRIVEVHPDSLRHTYYPLDQVPPSIELK